MPLRQNAYQMIRIDSTLFYYRSYLSPFAKRKNEAFKKTKKSKLVKNIGGKPDDITVIVAQIEVQPDEVNKINASVAKPKFKISDVKMSKM